jgi:hypothetical protein
MSRLRQCCNPQIDAATKQHFATNQPYSCEKLDDPRNYFRVRCVASPTQAPEGVRTCGEANSVTSDRHCKEVQHSHRQ